MPADGLSDDRHKGGASPVRGADVERGNLDGDAKGDSPKWEPHEEPSTDASARGGQVRSSDEAR